jgi:hypothetical protein
MGRFYNNREMSSLLGNDSVNILAATNRQQQNCRFYATVGNHLLPEERDNNGESTVIRYAL